MPKILLVEDDTNLSEIYQARMMAEGYDIVVANDGEAALALAAKEKPDLVISDVMMPKISGFEMLDILRNTEGLRDIKIIMLTALGQAEDRTRADALGADKYLVKSQVTLEDIVKTAQDLLGGAQEEPAVAVDSAAIAPLTMTAAPAAAEPVVAPVAVAAPVVEPQPVASEPAPTVASSEPVVAAVPAPIVPTSIETVPVLPTTPVAEPVVTAPQPVIASPVIEPATQPVVTAPVEPTMPVAAPVVDSLPAAPAPVAAETAPPAAVIPVATPPVPVAAPATPLISMPSLDAATPAATPAPTSAASLIAAAAAESAVAAPSNSVITPTTAATEPVTPVAEPTAPATDETVPAQPPEEASPLPSTETAAAVEPAATTETPATDSGLLAPPPELAGLAQMSSADEPRQSTDASPTISAADALAAATGGSEPEQTTKPLDLGGDKTPPALADTIITPTAVTEPVTPVPAPAVVSAPAEPTPVTPAPATGDNQVMADAIQQLLAGSSQAEAAATVTPVATPVTDPAAVAQIPVSQPATTPELPTMAEPAVIDNADGEVAHKKVIRPITAQSGRPDINALLAQEEARSITTQPAPTPVIVGGNNTVPQVPGSNISQASDAPGNVVAPSGANSQPKSSVFDPNSISL